MNKKVYAILHNSYEFDDLNYGDLTPSFMSLNKDTVLKKFKEIKENEISNFYRIFKMKENWLNEHPEFKEDYQIIVNTKDELEIFCDNWCYIWKLTEYELN